MNKVFLAGSILFFALSVSNSVFAQDEEQQPLRTPKWISEKGYWVVQSNIHTPKHSIIYFYNNDDVQVYKEEIDGVKVNLNKDRTKMRLKKILEQSIVAWETTHQPKENEQWVAKALR